MLIANRIALGNGIAADGYVYVVNIVREAMVTIGANKVMSTQSGFQVKIDLSDLSVGFWAGIEADAGNLRAYTSGGAELPIDIPYVDTNNRVGWAFVRMDVPTTGVVFYLRTIAGAGKYADSATYGMAAVWNGMAAVFSGSSLKNRASATGAMFTTPNSPYSANLTDRPGWASFAIGDTSRCSFQALTGKNLYGWTVRGTVKSLLTITTASDYACLGHGQSGWTGTYPSYYYNFLSQYSTLYKLHAHSRNWNVSSSTDKMSDLISSAANSFPSNEDHSIAWTVATYTHNIYSNVVNVGSYTSANTTNSSANMNSPCFSVGSNSYGQGAGMTGSMTDAYLCLGQLDVARLKAEHDNWNWAKAGKGFYSIAA